MPRDPSRTSPPATAPAESQSPAAPLAAQLKRESAASHEALESFGLSPESYEGITQRLAESHAELLEAGATRAAARLQRLTTVVAQALAAPASDLEARGRAYLAMLDSVLLQSIAAEAPGPKWIQRLDSEAAAVEADDSTGSLALLTVAGMCADVGAKVAPAPTGPITVEWKGWRFGLVAAHAPDTASIPTRVAAGVETLRAARMPGLVVLDLAQPVCPEQRPLRAAHPDAGAAELRARLDRILHDSRAAIVAACDRDHAVGVIGAAFLAVHLVVANQMAFLTAYRFMSLLDPADPREHTLGQFRRRFGDL